ncbi:thiamine phosphate synthase [Flavobacterium jejuense]|uniref:Thiamine phosphate synthase n=1 Tax=Flavobacterium jejuense TaxID=1544455 RepID=A0ABX0IW90_9FLAO|nr:thiamine phosphate synthase [Flavobacterium jejuense]NHN27968.1 thiamine phosphate synthase [Flavobacterium jejuense]
MIVISNPMEIVNETNIINALFEEGMELFHIRKPNYSIEELRSFLSAINSSYYSKLVLHQHHVLAEKFQIKRLHFTEKDRLAKPNRFLKPVRFLSTSVHSITDFNGLPNIFDYSFLSPIYSSISKENYVPTKNAFEEIKKRTNQHTKLIALGGVSVENIKNTLSNGFDNIAILGTIWNSKNPIENFKKCQKIVHSF